ncbi:L,D-transpeptidase family protein [Vibrio sp. SCSIO 43136]|uniref:L,D-transpeptidase family protein n=1 Tax=Vibrio sp. SCSIO 43136 TaxID=2819101 RepID=UPI002075C8F8|nr:L,D-transpeptidase family protein [Vibrio sp. SCSIO 43136]USD67675.1 L,D-transpeptidase family protein [Vibrio sp. SCSIO 43136]
MTKLFHFILTFNTVSILFASLLYAANGEATPLPHQPSVENRVEVDKSRRRMYVFINNVVVAEYKVALGGSPKGHKREEGDQKTPEGWYTLDYIKSNSSFYKSMHISYPNKKDRLLAEARGVDPGGMVMVHGQKQWHPDFAPIAQQFDWTDGCIAITNKEMEQFLNLVKVGTPIHIYW